MVDVLRVLVLHKEVVDPQFNGGNRLQVIVLFKVKAHRVYAVHRNFAGHELFGLFVLTLALFV